MPPSRASEIAIADSVTVSIALETSGIESRIRFVNQVEVSTLRGRTVLGPGTSSTSSYVMPSVASSFSIGFDARRDLFIEPFKEEVEPFVAKSGPFIVDETPVGSERFFEWDGPGNVLDPREEGFEERVFGRLEDRCMLAMEKLD
jgi:hypothetical protein